MRVMLVEDMTALRGEWSSLFANDPAATPFASFEWLSTWCRHWGSGGTPWILTVYDGERLVGLAPLMMSRRGGFRFITGLGVGVGNYWDIIARAEHRQRVAAELAAELRRRSAEWDAFFMDKLPEESETRAALRAAGLRLDRERRMPSPRIELPESFEDYLAGLSSNRRWRLRRYLRAIDEGELTVRTVTDADELWRAVECWQSLRADWWSRRGRKMDPEHGSERFLAFAREAVTTMAATGHAAVWEVTHRDEVVGVAINFIDSSTFYYWLAGFDFRVERLRPGHALIAAGIRWSIETRRRYFDFMLGDEPYKYHYGPRDRAVLAATVGNPRLRSRATVGLSHLRHALVPASIRIPFFGRHL